jgi:hypothetical protein
MYVNMSTHFFMSLILVTSMHPPWPWRVDGAYQGLNEGQRQKPSSRSHGRYNIH